MPNSIPSGDSDVAKDKMLQYKITHVFCPLQLPDGDDHSLSNDQELCKTVYASAHAYTRRLSGLEKLHWHHIVGMLRRLNHTTAFEALDVQLVTSQLQSISVGGKRCTLCHLRLLN